MCPVQKKITLEYLQVGIESCEHDNNAQTPPEHLSEASRNLWQRVLADYELELHHRELLRLALEALDRCEQARAILAEEGVVYHDRFGSPRAHPAVSIERDARIAAARLWRELDLEGEVLPDPRMPRRR